MMNDLWIALFTNWTYKSDPQNPLNIKAVPTQAKKEDVR